MLKTLVTAVALASVAVIAMLAVWSASDGTGEVSAATAVDIAIDMAITGDNEDGAGAGTCSDTIDNGGDTVADSADADCSNGPRLAGFTDVATNIQDCGEIDSTGTNTIDIDIVLPSPGIDAAGIKAYQFDLLYDQTVVNVTAENQNFLLAQASGSNLFSFSDPLPDSDGTFTSATVDIGSPPDPEPTGISEVDAGVIVRLTLTGVAPGITPLTLSYIVLANAVGVEILIDEVFQATVSVDELCTPPDPPTPTLTVVKVVINDDGGTAVVGDFTLRVDGFIAPWGVANPVSIGDHTVDENDPGPGYTKTIGGDCYADGKVTVGVGSNEDKTCTITNDDVPATPTPTPIPTPIPTPTRTPTPTATPTPTPTGGAATPTPTPTGGAPAPTATPTAAGAATPAVTPAGGAAAGAVPGPKAAPQTGDGIPLNEGGGGSVLPWLFVGLGVMITIAAAGYVAYSARGGFASGGGRAMRRLFR